MTDFRSKSSSLSTPPPSDDNPEILLEELKELQNQVFHLKRSNDEMHEVDPNGQDVDFQEAISENKVVILKLMLREQEIKNKLGPHYTESTTAISTTTLAPSSSLPPTEKQEEEFYEGGIEL